MRKSEKKTVILEFLDYMEKKHIHLTKYDTFKDNSIWSKENPQPSHRTMIKVQFEVNRLNQSDKEIALETFLTD